MFKFVIIAALLTTAIAQHHGFDHGHARSHGSSDDAHADIKHYEADVHEHGFRYGFGTSNKIEAFAEGDEHGNVHGKFGWISPEGKHVEVSYDADENGYQPKSNVLPTPPPIPQAILKSLQYIASHPHEEVSDYHGRRV